MALCCPPPRMQGCCPPMMRMPEPGPELAQRCVTVQQPPRLVVQKKVIFVKKIIPTPKLINGMREICVPHVTSETMIVRIPKLTWVTQAIKEPCVTWSAKVEAEPILRCDPRLVVEPREVCQAILCQPTPQIIPVPAPTEYCCYATGPATLNCAPSSRYECGACPPYVPPGPASPMFPPQWCNMRPGMVR